jgi:hypothetical protein
MVSAAHTKEQLDVAVQAFIRVNDQINNNQG